MHISYKHFFKSDHLLSLINVCMLTAFMMVWMNHHLLDVFHFLTQVTILSFYNISRCLKNCMELMLTCCVIPSIHLVKTSHQGKFRVFGLLWEICVSHVSDGTSECCSFSLSGLNVLTLCCYHFAQIPPLVFSSLASRCTFPALKGVGGFLFSYLPLLPCLFGFLFVCSIRIRKILKSQHMKNDFQFLEKSVLEWNLLQKKSWKSVFCFQ